MTWELPEEIVADVIKLAAGNKEFPLLKTDTPVLLIYGSAGSGKSRWAVNYAMGGVGWEFCNAMELIDEMRNACSTDDGVRDRIRHLEDSERLIVDDLGTEQKDRFAKYKTEYRPHEIFRIALLKRCRIDRRTIITTNAKPEGLLEMYDKSAEGQEGRGRIFSRFSNHARIFFFKGDRRKGEVFNYSERTYLLEGPDDKQTKTELTRSVKATLPLYEQAEEQKQGSEASEREIRQALKAIRGKPELEQVFFEWLKGTKFSHLVKRKEA